MGVLSASNGHTYGPLEAEQLGVGVLDGTLRAGEAEQLLRFAAIEEPSSLRNRLVALGLGNHPSGARLGFPDSELLSTLPGVDDSACGDEGSYDDKDDNFHGEAPILRAPKRETIEL